MASADGRDMNAEESVKYNDDAQLQVVKTLPCESFAARR